MSKAPELLSGLVWGNPSTGEAAIEELYGRVREENVCGVKLHLLFNAYTANDAIVFPVMEAARDLRIPVFVHCGHPPFSLPWSIAQLTELYPEMPVVMVRMGHGYGCKFKHPSIWGESRIICFWNVLDAHAYQDKRNL